MTPSPWTVEAFLADAESALEEGNLVGAGICLGWAESLLCDVQNEHPDWARYNAVSDRAWSAGRALREERKAQCARGVGSER